MPSTLHVKHGRRIARRALARRAFEEEGTGTGHLVQILEWTSMLFMRSSLVRDSLLCAYAVTAAVLEEVSGAVEKETSSWKGRTMDVNAESERLVGAVAQLKRLVPVDAS